MESTSSPRHPRPVGCWRGAWVGVAHSVKAELRLDSIRPNIFAATLRAARLWRQISSRGKLNAPLPTAHAALLVIEEQVESDEREDSRVRFPAPGCGRGAAPRVGAIWRSAEGPGRAQYRPFVFPHNRRHEEEGLAALANFMAKCHCKRPPASLPQASALNDFYPPPLAPRPARYCAMLGNASAPNRPRHAVKTSAIYPASGKGIQSPH